LRHRIPNEFAARLREPAAFLWYPCSFTASLIVRSNSKICTEANSRLPEELRFMQTAGRCFQAQPGGSGGNAADLQISPEYVYPSGIHTDSFFLSAELALSLADVLNRRPGAMRRVGFQPRAFTFLNSTRNWMLSLKLVPRNL